MHVYMYSIIAVLTVASCSSRKESTSALPATWTRDFTISLYNGGGMQDASTNITFTYDSCIYVARKGSEKSKKSFMLTEAMRKDIIKKMHELQADNIRTIEEGLTLDKETDQICFNTDTLERCISESASQEIHQADRDRFSDAWKYLSDFAMDK